MPKKNQPFCKRCNKPLKPFEDIFFHFKIIEGYSKELVEIKSNNKGKFGICLCYDCSKLFDEFMNLKDKPYLHHGFKLENGKIVSK